MLSISSSMGYSALQYHQEKQMAERALMIIIAIVPNKKGVT